MLDVAFVDHYDSFSYNLIDWLQTGSKPVRILHHYFNDPELLGKIPRDIPLVFSPGPGHPANKEPSLALAKARFAKVPILGVCLGHQILGFLDGMSIAPASHAFHGSLRTIIKCGQSRFLSGMPESFRATSYNSLAVKLPEKTELFRVAARCEFGDIQVIESLESLGEPSLGLQYHPESYLSEDQDLLRETWLDQLG